MEELDNRPASSPGYPSSTAETVLRAVTEELQNLQQTLLGSLHEDVEQLKAEKSRLQNDIKQLQDDKEQLLSQRQTAQQQLWARQLAQVLANHLQEQIKQQAAILAASPQLPGRDLADATSVNNFNKGTAYQLLASLDSTLSTSLRSLQQDIHSYQSDLSQQLSRMYGLEQQGEAILEALVERLRIKLEAAEEVLSPLTAVPVAEADTTAQPISPDSSPPLSTAPVPGPYVTATNLHRPRRFTPLQIGLLLVLGSAVCLSLYNVIIRIILKPRLIFGLFELGGFITPSLGNSLLILFLRMLVVVPLMVIVAPFLYPQVWNDIQKVASPLTSRGGSRAEGDRILPLSVLSGGFLFLSQVLIYIAIGQIPTGIAITLFFIYPIITVLLAWLLFRDRPTAMRFAVIGIICLGDFLASPTGGVSGNILLGTTTAVGSGVAFAFYVIFTQICASKLHPIPFSLINFVTILLLSFLSLMLPLPAGISVQVNPLNLPSLIVGSLVLGAITLVGYLLNNFGIRQLGAARAAIIGSSGPALTAILAYTIVQETLQGQQILGMLLVTLGVAALSFERMQLQAKGTKAAK